MWAQPEVPGNRVSLIGDWDGWLAPGISMHPNDEYPGWQSVWVDLDPGEHHYLLFEDGIARIDPHNGQTGFWEPDGRQPVEVSHVVVGDCRVPQLQVTQVDSDDDDRSIVVHAQFLASASAPAEVEPGSVRVEKFERMSGVYSPTQAAVSVTPETGEVTAKIEGLEATKHSFRIVASDVAGKASEPQRISHWVSPRARSPEDMVIYQVMVDRFRGPEGQALAPPENPGARAGGALGGITAAIQSGELSALGVTTLWLSPVYLNPEAARLGRDDDHLYEGYHGYWVLDPRMVDPRLGGEHGLRELIATAHDAGIGVLLDVVPNHVYEDSTRYTERLSDAWFNFHETGECVCGVASCPWHLYIQNCWFTDYLPDFRFETLGVIDQAVADVLWWEQTFDIDGVRIDAVPMMPRAVSRRITSGLRAARRSTPEVFVVGEVFTGGGQGGIDELRFHLGPDGLNSVFDFPLMWALREALAGSGGEGFAAVERTLEDTQAALTGSGARLGRMIGNHDVTRFISEVAGDAGADPWGVPALQPTNPEVYRRQQLALTLVMTLPGVPVVYYGDEIGLAGGRDPDSRRVMPAEQDLMPIQIDLRAAVRELGSLRRCSPALRRGTRRTLSVTPEQYVYVRTEAEREVLVAVSRAPEAVAIDLENTGLQAQTLVDAVADRGEPVTLVDGRGALHVPAFGARVLVPKDDPCLAAQTSSGRVHDSQ